MNWSIACAVEMAAVVKDVHDEAMGRHHSSPLLSIVEAAQGQICRCLCAPDDTRYKRKTPRLARS
jgi:hypothetical protein